MTQYKRSLRDLPKTEWIIIKYLNSEMKNQYNSYQNFKL